MQPKNNHAGVHTVSFATLLCFRHFTKLCKIVCPWESVSEIQSIQECTPQIKSITTHWHSSINCHKLPGHAHAESVFCCVLNHSLTHAFACLSVCLSTSALRSEAEFLCKVLHDREARGLSQTIWSMEFSVWQTWLFVDVSAPWGEAALKEPINTAIPMHLRPTKLLLESILYVCYMRLSKRQVM